ncbi:MAG TPA: nucleoside phosphorylase [Polyangiales bacterium]
MSYLSAQRVQTSEGRQYHLGVAPGDVAELILLVGDPERARRAAARFDSVRFQNQNRDYSVYTGSQQGRELSVICVGMGSGCMEIALVELCQVTQEPSLIRAGTCGVLQPGIELGDLVIAQGAVRLETASLAYVEPGFPAFAHAEAQVALVRAAAELGTRFHVGVCATTAGFYGAQGRSVPGFSPRDPELLPRLTRQGVLALEMETSCLLTLAALRGLRAGAACTAFASRARDVFIDPRAKEQAEDGVVAVGLAALHHMADMRTERDALCHWHPGLKR